MAGELASMLGAHLSNIHSGRVSRFVKRLKTKQGENAFESSSAALEHAMVQCLLDSVNIKAVMRRHRGAGMF